MIAEVAVVEPTGSESYVLVRIGSIELTCVFRERVNLRAGDAICIRPRLDCVHLFDEASGGRLNDDAI
jgi:multiple sugar transport system ATP-binding protein